MKAVDILKQEHEVIQRALELLGRAARRIRAGEAVPDGFCAWAVGFFQHFADHCHHAKEEDILFPLLEERGILREGGPIGVMLDEHEIGRDCVRRMQHALEDPDKIGADFAAAAEEYGSLLAQHIFKENNVLFEMARQRLSEEDAARLLKQFHEVECAKGGQEAHERFESELTAWEERCAGE